MTNTASLDVVEDNKEILIKCDNCGCEIKENNMFSHNDENYCEDCFNELFMSCSRCDEHHNIDDIIEVDGEFFCQTCFDRYCFKCADCNRNFKIRGNDYAIHTGDSVCSSCIENYGMCEICNEYYLLDDLISDDDYCYCASCYEDREHCGDNDAKALDLTDNTFIEMPFQRTYGLEIETSTENYTDDTIYFQRTEDGSIDGKEYVSPILAGDKGLAALQKELDNGLNDEKVDRKCGLHLHIGAKDLTWNDIKKVYFVYKFFEPLIYAMIPKSRKNGSWAKPIDNNIIDIHAIMDSDELIYKYYKTKKENVNFKQKYHAERYHGFNLHSYFFRGTIELRYHSGTLDYHKIKNWILINQILFAYALKYSYTALQRKLKIRSKKLTIFEGIISEFIHNHQLALNGKPDLYNYILERIEKFKTSDDDIAREDI